MAYWFTRFGTTDLSLINLRQTDVPRGNLGLVPLPGGGVHDPWGEEQAPISLPTAITVSCEHVATTPAAFQAEIYALRALLRTRARLYRSPDGGEANSESVLARLETISAPRDSDNVLVMPVTLTFQALEPTWRGAVHTETITLDASPKTAEIDNDGNAVQRAVTITVTATGAPITDIAIENLETGHVSHISYDGGIAVGESLVLDCGALTCRNDGTADYAHLHRETGHAIREWLRLMPGANTIRVTRTGGDNSSTCVLSYYDAWA
jgi:hypothetical protein